ncbi:MAG TPA: ABC transporter ATP-binding protein [Actinomycetota bacterium]|nr:ABC transporter ATP-binding protein [Actinomycetota bacterium]
MDGELVEDRTRAGREPRPAGPLRRLAPVIRPYRGHLLFAAAVSSVMIVAQVLLPKVFERFVNDVVEAGRADLVGRYAAAALALGAIATACGFLRRNATGTVSLGVERDLRSGLYAHLQSLHVGFHDGWQSGQLVSRAVSDIGRIRRFLGFGLLWLFILGQTFLWVMFWLFRLDAWLALATLGFCTPVIFISHRFARRYREVSRRSQDQLGDLTNVVEESAGGVRVIKSYGREAQRSALYERHARTLVDINLEQVYSRAGFWSLDNALLGLNVVVILLVGGLRVMDGGMSLGALVAFITYQGMLVWPVRDIGWIIAGGQEAHAAAERIWEILDTEPEIADAPGAVELTSTEGRLRFEDVSFTYPGTSREVLSRLELEVTPGETLAVVGMTGSGKSTLTSLIARFYDPTAGRVTLDGIDLRELSVRPLRGHVGVAFEDPILFSLSVRENLLMGNPEADDATVWEALELAQAAAFVRDLPWGLDTRVGEQGYSLSGGQRQRLALARAVVGRPRLLVLDNPMSSVDVHTEAAIEASLRSILQGRTAVLVAHRPSTLLLADRVALLHEGRIVATGTHHDLLRDVPLYREVLAADVSGVHA